MHKSNRYRFLLPLMLLVLTACATTPIVDDAIALKPDDGLVAIGFVSNWKGNESSWFENMVFTAHRMGEAWPKTFTLRSNDDAQLVALPAGRYRWGAVTIGSNKVFLDSQHGFEVERGKIVYLGDVASMVTPKLFSLSSDDLSVRDNQAATIARLKQEYPELMSQHPLVKQITTMIAK